MRRDDNACETSGSAVSYGRAAGHYASSIRARRDLLQTLYYATKNSGLEAAGYHRQAELARSQQGEDPNGSEELIRTLEDAQHAAEATAQDAAWSFMLIVDYAIRRLEQEMREINTRAPSLLTLGAETRTGVRLNAAIRAFANQARHFHEWIALGAAEIASRNESKRNVATIIALDYDPLDANASREFLSYFPVMSYFDLEGQLLQTARDAITAEGDELGIVLPGSYSIITRSRD
ncbi:MAG: hypothetical protein WCE44_13410 [Candidatus Velthaea sp.]